MVNIRVKYKIRVQFRVTVRVKENVMVEMVFRVRVWLYLPIQWRATGGGGGYFRFTVRGLVFNQKLGL